MVGEKKRENSNALGEEKVFKSLGPEGRRRQKRRRNQEKMM